MVQPNQTKYLFSQKKKKKKKKKPKDLYIPIRVKPPKNHEIMQKII